ncbi:MAG: helix-turn-helix transcriptional regulator [Pseudomonadota bacterium]
MPNASQQDFQTVCREWRQYRKLSQLELALAADVSQRHVSWLETGKSVPSREMVIRLSEAMQVPLRERNRLLQSAGYASVYGESQLDEPAMAPILDALNLVLDHHEPLPAMVVDRSWNVRKANRSADRLLRFAGVSEDMLARIGGGEELNVALLTVHPEGLRGYISNWVQAAPAFVRRLRSEAIASGNAELKERFARYIELAGPMPENEPANGNLLPVLPLELDMNGLKLSMFSVISTFGTPQDITTDELRIEAFYPTDDATKRFFTEAQGAAG